MITRNSKKHTHALVAALAPMIAATALPALATNTDLFDMPLEELVNVRITTSTLTPETLHTAPSSVSVFTREEIRRLGIKNLEELVNYVPGYQSARTDYSSITQSISSRGRRLGNGNGEILIMIDGQRLNSDWGGGIPSFESLIPLDNVERVEFIRGPGSAVFGSNAMMGVINIITRSERTLEMSTGHDQYHELNGQWQEQAANGGWQVFARGLQSQGERQDVFEPFLNPATPTEVSTRESYRANDFYAQGSLYDFTLALRATERDTNGFYQIGFVDPLDHGSLDTRTQSLNLGWKHQFTPQLSLDGHVFDSYKHFDVEGAASLIPYYFIQGGISEREPGTSWLFRGKNATANWLLGWEWRRPELINTDAHYGPPNNPYQFDAPQAPENGRVIQGVFGQVQLPLSETLELTTGLRYDHYSDFGGHYSPRLALVKKLGEGDTGKLLYSEAYRAPSRLETSVYNSPASASNPDLKPEVAKTSEAVWVHDLKGGFVTTSVFNTVIDNAIEDTVLPTLQRSYANGHQSVGGVELEWQQHWTENWGTRVAATQIFDPAETNHMDSNTLFGGSLGYQENKWTSSLLANYQSFVVDPNEQQYPSDITTTEHTRFGGHTVYAWHVAYAPRKQLSLFLHVNNLLDKRYKSPAARPTNYEGVPAEGRALVAGFQWRFD